MKKKSQTCQASCFWLEVEAEPLGYYTEFAEAGRYPVRNTSHSAAWKRKDYSVKLILNHLNETTPTDEITDIAAQQLVHIR